MAVIERVTLIEAPMETCFHFSLSIDLELEAAKHYGLRAVSGVTSGRIGPGQRVEWSTRQFGIPVSHESEITAFDAPRHFQDKMVRGLFRSFQHDHHFRALSATRTEMRDRMVFEMPWWLSFAAWIVRIRLAALLDQRNRAIQRASEGLASQ